MECRVRQVTASEADKQWVKEFTAAARDRAGVGGEGSSMWGLFDRLLKIFIFFILLLGLRCSMWTLTSSMWDLVP